MDIFVANTAKSGLCVLIQIAFSHDNSSNSLVVIPDFMLLITLCDNLIGSTFKPCDNKLLRCVILSNSTGAFFPDRLMMYMVSSGIYDKSFIIRQHFHFFLLNLPIMHPFSM